MRLFLEAARGAPLRGDLGRTPRRVVRAWREDLLSGYRQDPVRILEPLRAGRSSDVVAVKNLDFVSTCSHHLLPFHGKVHVAYLPEGRITGISRIAGMIRCLSRRLQIQEDLTRQIVSALQKALHPRGAACVVEATHLCMAARGGRGSSGTVVTTAFAGRYEKTSGERAEVLALLGVGPDARPRRKGRRGD